MITQPTPRETPITTQEMIISGRYVVKHMIGGVQRFPRLSLLVYIGPGMGSGEHQEQVFSGRDMRRGTRVCGTTSLQKGHILAIWDAPPDAELYVNRRAG